MGTAKLMIESLRCERPPTNLLGSGNILISRDALVKALSEAGLECWTALNGSQRTSVGQKQRLRQVRKDIRAILARLRSIEDIAKSTWPACHYPS